MSDEQFKKYRKKPIIVEAYQTDEEKIIETLEGKMKANKGDYIIKGIKGELYPCKADIFYETYDKVENDTQYNEVARLKEENEQLQKIGVMYQGYNPCSNCAYCVEGKVCCAEVPILCDDAKKNFIQGLCKKYKQIQKSFRRYDDD